ncbi:hypothetical protein M758_2G157300 [Ceratodon purpureus]|nr:hypothetical protein M758_2G157300 [Ceratodon purpureus]
MEHTRISIIKALEFPHHSSLGSVCKSFSVKMEGFVSGRKRCSTSLVVLVLCLGSLLLAVVASSELPFLQPLQHGAVSESTERQGTQHRHWLRDHMPWSRGSRHMDHHPHRVVHEYQPRPYKRGPCILTRSEYDVIQGHRLHLRGTPGNYASVNGIVRSSTPTTAWNVLENGKPTPPGGNNPPPNPSTNSIVRVVPPRLAPLNGILDKPTPGGHPPPPSNPHANVIVEMVSPPVAAERASIQ